MEESDMPGVIIFFPESDEEFIPHIVTSITPGRASETTENEIEDGSSISDHRNIGPRTLSLTCYVSDVPLDATGTHDPERVGPHVIWRERLELADIRSELLTIDIGVTRGQIFENMAITSLDTQWDADSGNGFEFNLSLKEVRIASPKVRNLTAERIEKQRLELIDLRNKTTLMPALRAGQLNGVLGSTGQTLVNGQETLSRFQPGRALGRLTTSAAPGALADLTSAIADPAGLPGTFADFAAGR